MYLINLSLNFLETLSSRIFEEQKHFSPDFSKSLIVFPSKRSITYFRKLFLKSCGKEAIYPPELKSLENFISELYLDNFDREKAHKLKRVFLLKKSLSLNRNKFANIFKTGDSKILENFFDFASYGNKLLKFFDELIEEDISFDSLKKEVLYTDYEQQIDILSEIFTSYRTLLEESGLIDKPGMLNELISQFNTEWFSNYNKIYLCGFFALNRLETELFKKISETGKSEIILHSKPEKILTDNNNPSFSHHKNIIDNIQPDYFNNQDESTFQNSQSRKPAFIVKELKSNFEQVSFIVESTADNLSKGIAPEKIAVILPDESISTLITPAFENYGIQYNLTVGQSLRETALFSFISFLTELLQGNFYYKDVIRFIKHPFVKNALFNKMASKGFCYSLIKFINKHNLVTVEPGTDNFKKAFANKNYPESYKDCSDGICRLMEDIKEGFLNAKDIKDITLFVKKLVENTISLSSEKLLSNQPFLSKGMEKIYNTSREIISLSEDYGKFADNDEKFRFLTFLLNEISQQHITMTGTPFSGVQIMGVLEARNLNFDAVIMPSMNEGLFPAENQKDFFLNSKTRRTCGLPTYKEREALYGLYFEEITGCAKFVSISYLREEANSNSLPSRFIESESLLNNQSFIKQDSQTAFHFPCSKGLPSYPVQKIKKSDVVIEKILKHKFSPNSLKNYIECPVRFYFKNILKIREEEQVVEEFDAMETGKFVHETLKNFIPHLFNGINKLTEEELYKILIEEFDKAYKKQGTDKFSDRLMLKVVKNKFRKFVKNEITRKESGYSTNPSNLELEAEASFSINDKTAVTLYGRIDRIDEKDGKYFLIDYKTGKIPSDKDVIDFSNNPSEIQLSVYAFLFCGMRSIPEEKIEGLGYYDLKEGFKIKFLISANEMGNYLEDSAKYIKKIISEMLDKNTPFRITDDVENCSYCNYPDICRINELSGILEGSLK